MNYFDLDPIKETLGETKYNVTPAINPEYVRHYKILVGKPNYPRLHDLVQQRYKLVENYSNRLIPEDLFTKTLELYENAIKEELMLM